jgi:hypothetical protein
MSSQSRPSPAPRKPRSDPFTLTRRTQAASSRLPPAPPLRLIAGCWYTTRFAAENFKRAALGLPLLVDEPAQVDLVALTTLAHEVDMNLVTLKRHFKAARLAILALAAKGDAPDMQPAAPVRRRRADLQPVE